MASTNLGSVQRAADLIRAYITETPVLSSASISQEIGDDIKVFMKCECFQRTGSFKFRGALNAILSYEIENGPIKSVVTHSSGNHGKALALAARARGIVAHVVMPEDAPQVKKDAVRDAGGKVVLVPNNYEARKRAAKQIQEREGALLIHSSHDHRVMSGQGTLALEFLAQVARQGEALDVIVCPVGGGGLVAGVARAVEGLAAAGLLPGGGPVAVVGAEPAGAADAARSKARGALVGHEEGLRGPPRTIADGLLPVLGGATTWPAVRDAVAAVLVVGDAEVAAAMRALRDHLGVVAEPSGAIGLAAVRSPAFRARFPGARRVGVVVSGGNIELGHFQRLVGLADRLNPYAAVQQPGPCAASVEEGPAPALPAAAGGPAASAAAAAVVAAAAAGRRGAGKGGPGGEGEAGPEATTDGEGATTTTEETEEEEEESDDEESMEDLLEENELMLMWC